METEKNIKDWIGEWCNLYPDMEFNGYKLRSEPKDCIKKMVKFCKDHPEYTKHTIFDATKAYLHQQAERNYDYTKQSTYFISKLGQPSVLEAFCKRVYSKPVTAEYPLTPDECFNNPINDFI